MLNARRTLLLAAWLVVAGCSSDGPTEAGEGTRPPVGDTVVAATAANGQTTVVFQGEESEHRIGLTLRDFDSEQGVAGLEVHAIALADGVFLRTEDPAGRYFSSTRYIRWSDFQPSGAQAARLAVSPSAPDLRPAPVALVAVTGLVIAVYAVGSAIYEYATDPPGFEDVFNDDGTQSTCLTGDLNDVLSAWGAGGVRTVSGAIRVLGAPARLRGVTSINLGFTRLAVYQQFNVEAFTVLVDNYTGLLDSDVAVWCWPRAGNQVIPIIRGEVTRQATQFDIVKVLSQATYPVYAHARPDHHHRGRGMVREPGVSGGHAGDPRLLLPGVGVLQLERPLHHLGQSAAADVWMLGVQPRRSLRLHDVPRTAARPKRRHHAAGDLQLPLRKRRHKPVA